MRELSRGLAIPALIQYLAWQVVPGACPDCGRHLRPASTPAMPWFAAASNRSTPSASPTSVPTSPSRGLFSSFKMPPSMKAWKGPRGWKSSDGSGRAAAFLPPWFPGQQRYADLDEDGNYTAAPTGHEGETAHPHNGAAERGGADASDEPGAAAATLVAPYRDDPEAAGEPSTLTSDLIEEPEEVTVVGKKKKKRSVDQGSSTRVWES